MTAIPPAPVPLAPLPNPKPLAVGTLLYRVFHPDYPPNSFNPGRGSPTRFAPIWSSDGKVISTLYLGQTRECAFHERIFHDVPLTGAFRHIDFARVADLHFCTLRTQRTLRLAALFTADLGLWGIGRGQLIDTLQPTYPHTARWAEAIHRASGDFHGLIWSSRLCEPDGSLMLFGDRVMESDLRPDGPSRKIASDPELMAALIEYARRTGIVILNPPPLPPQ